MRTLSLPPKTVPSSNVIEISDGVISATPSRLIEYLTPSPVEISATILPSGEETDHVFCAPKATKGRQMNIAAAEKNCFSVIFPIESSYFQ